MESDGSARQTRPQGGKGKGKGKASEEKMAPVHNEPRSDALLDAQPTKGSAVSRIASSATNLASNLISNSAHLDVAGQILPTNKAASSSATFRPSIGETSNYRSQPIESAAGQRFKSAHVQDHIAREEAAFSAFLDGTSVSEAPGSHPSEPILTGSGASTLLQTSQDPNTTDYSQTDGMEVVRILDSGYEEVNQPEAEIPITSEEAVALRRALFQDGAESRRTGGHNVDWGSILNFFPGQYLSGFLFLCWHAFESIHVQLHSQ
jgi:hypothetical protein